MNVNTPPFGYEISGNDIENAQQNLRTKFAAMATK